MRAELAASLCIPKDQALSVEIDPLSIDARVSGKPSVAIQPFEVELPTIEVTFPTVIVDIPSPQLKVSLTPGTDPLAAFVASMVPVLQSVKYFDFAQAPNQAIFGTAVTALMVAHALTALALPSVSVDAKLTLGQVKLHVDGALAVKFGKVRVHAVPIGGPDQELKVGLDLGDSGIAVKTDALKAGLSGCVVLNGGDPLHTVPPPPTVPPGPRVFDIIPSVDRDRTTLKITVMGEGFGQPQGKGGLLVKDQTQSYVPGQYLLWSENTIVVAFRPALSAGPYSVDLRDANGTPLANHLYLSVP